MQRRPLFDSNTYGANLSAINPDTRVDWVRYRGNPKIYQGANDRLLEE
ncbi:MAG: hypothetical protein RL011_1675, partial [Pseudomonadota bacterium]